MGALTINNHKRNHDSFSLYTPLINSPNSISYSHQLDTTKSKKPRVLDTFRKYPDPVGRFRREVHAPCGAKRAGFWSRLTNRRFTTRISEAMGNVFGCSDTTAVADVIRKRAGAGIWEAISEESSEVVVLDDGVETRSVVCDENKGLGLLLETRKFDRNELGDSTALDREAYKKLLSRVDNEYSHRLTRLDFEIKWREAKLKLLRRQQEEELEGIIKPEKDALHEPFVLLTEEEEDEVKRALSNSNRRKVLVTHENSNIQITGEILQCLQPGAWLNDEVINVYLELLKVRERRDPKKYLNCHFFNTFFYKKLIGGRNGYDYKAVRRWTTQKKLGYKLSECDKIFVPIHKEVHWCLAVINKKDKTFQYLDSLGGRDLKVLKMLAKYYVDEVRDKCGQDIDVNSWELKYVEDLPEQQNGFDCGVFMIKYADFYSRGLGLQFNQENMPYFRRRTAKEILRLEAL